MTRLKELEKEARSEHIPIMQDSGMEFLLSYIRERPWIMRVLEAGTAVGWSAMNMAGIRPGITIDTIEVDPAMAALARRNIADADLDDRIFVYQMDADDFRTAKYYDLFFIDAAKSQYRRYLEHFLPNSYVGSVFIFDNLNFHGIVDDPSASKNRSTIQMTRKILKFREDLLKDERFETEFHPEIGDGVAAAKRIR